MSDTRTYTVTGMTCGGCADKVTDKVEQIPGITQVDVDLSDGSITLTSDRAIDDDAIRAAIEEAGYQLATS